MSVEATASTKRGHIEESHNGLRNVLATRWDLKKCLKRQFRERTAVLILGGTWGTSGVASTKRRGRGVPSDG